MLNHPAGEYSYALITAARDEEAHIERLIQAVASQVALPTRWIIVSDASSDRTDEIVKHYANLFSYVELLRLDAGPSRDFASKAHALNAARALLKADHHRFIAHLDADVSFGPTYMPSLLERFKLDPMLGIGGGFVYEERNGEFEPRPGNRRWSVMGGTQMFRRECYEAIGSILPLPTGGEDWHAEISARMLGWRVEAFPEIPVFHHRATGTAVRLLDYCYNQGLTDYALGSHPLFEILKLARRLLARPFVIGALARLSGFLVAVCRKHERPASEEFVRCLREEQMGRLWPFGAKHESVFDGCRTAVRVEGHDLQAAKRSTESLLSTDLRCRAPGRTNR